MSGPLEVRDWHALLDERPELAAESTRDRLPWLWGLFALAFALVLARAIQLELSTGAEARRLAARPIERQHALAAARGRIVARPGCGWPRPQGQPESRSVRRRRRACRGGRSSWKLRRSFACSVSTSPRSAVQAASASSRRQSSCTMT